MADRKIVGALGHEGVVYRAGMEKELLEAAKGSGLDLGPFVDSGTLVGDWGHTAGRHTALPSSFPERKLLEQAGYASLEMLRDASDEELLVLVGIGEEKLADIRVALEKVS